MQHFRLPLRLMYKEISLFTQHKQNKGRVFRDEKPCFVYWLYENFSEYTNMCNTKLCNTILWIGFFGLQK